MNWTAERKKEKRERDGENKYGWTYIEQKEKKTLDAYLDDWISLIYDVFRRNKKSMYTMKNDACLLIKSNRHSKDSEKWEHIWSKEGQMCVSWTKGLVELIERCIHSTFSFFSLSFVRSRSDEISFSIACYFLSVGDLSRGDVSNTRQLLIVWRSILTS